MTPAELRALWNELSLEERELVAYDVPEEDSSVEGWRRIVSEGLRAAESGALTPLGERMREEWEKVWRPAAEAKNLPKRRGGRR
jgi:hypothetical protein